MFGEKEVYRQQINAQPGLLSCLDGCVYGVSWLLLVPAVLSDSLMVTYWPGW